MQSELETEDLSLALKYFCSSPKIFLFFLINDKASSYVLFEVIRILFGNDTHRNFYRSLTKVFESVVIYTEAGMP